MGTKHIAYTLGSAFSQPTQRHRPMKCSLAEFGGPNPMARVYRTFPEAEDARQNTDPVADTIYSVLLREPWDLATTQVDGHHYLRTAARLGVVGMAKTGWDRKIPFDPKTGRMLTYVGLAAERNGVVWKDVYEFTATMRYVRYGRGRSSVTVTMADISTDAEYEISLASYMALTPWINVGVTGNIRWTFAKRGQNYLCEPVLRP